MLIWDLQGPRTRCHGSHLIQIASPIPPNHERWVERVIYQRPRNLDPASVPGLYLKSMGTETAGCWGRVSFSLSCYLDRKPVQLSVVHRLNHSTKSLPRWEKETRPGAQLAAPSRDRPGCPASAPCKPRVTGLSRIRQLPAANGIEPSRICNTSTTQTNAADALSPTPNSLTIRFRESKRRGWDPTPFATWLW